MADPRIPAVEDPGPEAAALLSATLGRDGRPLNIFATLANHPALLKQFNRLGGTLLSRGLIGARERELVILRVGWKSQAVYEFGQHTVIGRQAGLSEAEIAALTEPIDAHEWSEDDRVLIAFSDELCDTNDVSDTTWTSVATRWSEAQQVELLVLAGFYRMVSGFLNAARVQPEPGLPGWPTADAQVGLSRGGQTGGHGGAPPQHLDPA